MGIESVQEYLSMVASIVTSIGVLWLPFKKIYLDPREKLRKTELKWKKEREKQLIDDNNKRHDEMLEKLEEATSQQTKLFRQYDKRIDNLEEQNQEHEFRIFTLEKANGKQVRVYEEKYNARRDDN